jgi:hypothetical protein
MPKLEPFTSICSMISVLTPSSYEHVTMSRDDSQFQVKSVAKQRGHVSTG